MNLSVTLSIPKKTTLTLLIILPILIQWFELLLLSQNIPWVDDFFWYFDFLKQIDLTPSTRAFFQTLATPYNGHWHIFQRTILVLVTSAGLPINAIYFSLVGNLLFLALFYFLFVNNNEITVAAVAAAWLFFQPISHYNFYECGFFNLPVLLFTILAIRNFHKRKNGFFAWAILATISNGNGLLIWPILFLMALLRKDVRNIARISALFIVIVAVYFTTAHDFKSAGKLDLENTINAALYFIQLCGHFLPGIEGTTPWLPMILGILSLTTFIFIIPRALKNQEKVLFFALFILMSMGIVALTRKAVTGLSAHVINHYLLFPQLFFGCLSYILLKEYITNWPAKVLLCSCAVLISTVSNLAKLPILNGHHSLKTANLLNYELSKKWLLYPPIQGMDEYNLANQVTAYAITRGYYVLPVHAKKFLSETCTCQPGPEGSVRIEAELQKRVLNRELFIELTDKSNLKSYYPVTPHYISFTNWIKSKKNRRLETTLYLQYLPEPVNDITKCRLFTVN